ncbi:MAG: hypothetical protein AAB065_05475, partial [Deltaproteobacteria bacterium]
KIIATDIMLLEDAKKRRPKKTHILAPVDSIKEETFKTLKDVLLKNPGPSMVFLHLLYPDKREVVLSLPDELSIDPQDEALGRIKELMPGTEIRIV